jgi:hypothetical protein
MDATGKFYMLAATKLSSLLGGLFMAFAVQAAQTNLDALSTLMLQQPSIDIDTPVVVDAQFDPSSTPAGAISTYRITLNAMNESVDIPSTLPIPPGLDLIPGGRGQIFLPIGNKLTPRTTINFRASAKNPGNYIIPAFSLTAYGKSIVVPQARLTVTAANVAAAPGSPTVVVELPPGEFYTGQAIPLKVLLMDTGNNSVQGMTQLQIQGDAFMMDPSSIRQRRDITTHNGRSYIAMVAEVLVTPIRHGKNQLLAQVNAIINPALFGPNPSPALYMPLVDSAPVTLDILPLPKSGEPAGFTGAIGHFQLEPPKLSSAEVRAGDPVTLTVVVKGEGNITRFALPRPVSTTMWQIFPPTADTQLPNVSPFSGTRSFSYTLIPLSDRLRATPAIPFAFFDPQKKDFVDITIPPMPLKVNPAPGGVQPQTLALAPSLAESAIANNTEESRQPVMTGLAETPGWKAWSYAPLQQRAWFIALQILPAGLLAGLWAWNRRRQYLALHPELVRKRQAQRAFKAHLRALRKSVARQDGPGFIQSAIAALQVACAPRLAANPSALVCEDVLNTLSVEDCSGAPGIVIRKLFAAADSGHFSRQPGTEATLSLWPELEKTLSLLQQKLL